MQNQKPSHGGSILLPNNRIEHGAASYRGFAEGGGKPPLDSTDETVVMKQGRSPLLKPACGMTQALGTDTVSVRVSIVVPVFNEENTVGEVVAKLLMIPRIDEIILVDDGCRPEAAKELHRLASQDRVWLVVHRENQGKGAALRTGFEVATGDIIVVQDADLEYAPHDILPLLQPILRGEADVVYGSRYLNRNGSKGAGLSHLANWALTRLSNCLTGLGLTDMETGHKAFCREAIAEIVIEENRFGVEPELTAKLARRGWRFKEVPVSYEPRSRAEGKKIGWIDGLRALWCIMRYR